MSSLSGALKLTTSHILSGCLKAFHVFVPDSCCRFAYVWKMCRLKGPDTKQPLLLLRDSLHCYILLSFKTFLKRPFQVSKISQSTKQSNWDWNNLSVNWIPGEEFPVFRGKSCWKFGAYQRRAGGAECATREWGEQDSWTGSECGTGILTFPHILLCLAYSTVKGAILYVEIAPPLSGS